MHHSGITSATNKATTVTNICQKTIIVVKNGAITSDTTTKIDNNICHQQKFGNMAKLYINNNKKQQYYEEYFSSDTIETMCLVKGNIFPYLR